MVFWGRSGYLYPPGRLMAFIGYSRMGVLRALILTTIGPTIDWEIDSAPLLS
jgi:hypothetical protein